MSSFGIETRNRLIHSRSSLEKHTRFLTKMGKVYTRFQTKTSQKPYSLGRHIPIRLVQGSTPPPRYITLFWSELCRNLGRLKDLWKFPPLSANLKMTPGIFSSNIVIVPSVIEKKEKNNFIKNFKWTLSLKYSIVYFYTDSESVCYLDYFREIV